MQVARVFTGSHRHRWVLTAALLAGGCSQSAPTATEHAAHDHAATDEAAEHSLEKAVEITGRMLEVYRQADSYTDHAAYVEESVLRGEGVAHEIPYYEISVALHRPNQLRLEFIEALADADGGRQGFAIACDGELLRVLLAEIPDQMVENPAPAKFTADNVLVDPLIDEKLLGRSLGDLFPQLAMLLNESDADEAAIFPHDSHPRMLTNHAVDGRDCYRVATTHPEGTRVMWIDAESYVLRRMELPADAERARVDPDRRYLRLAIRIDFHDVTLDAEIAPDAFVLKAPPGAHRVRRFVVPEAEEATANDAKEEDDSAEGETAKDAKSAKEDGEDEEEGDEEEVVE